MWRHMVLRGPLPVLLGIVAGLGLCAVVYLALTFSAGPAPDPAQTAHAICADLTTQRYDNLYALLSPDLQQQGAEAQFAASQRELDSLLGPVRSCRATIGSNGGGAAGVTLALQRGQATNAQVALTQAQGAWRIASYDQTV
jgi:hypothetical protein